MPTLQLPSACTVVEYATLLMVTVSTAPAFRPLLPPGDHQRLTMLDAVDDIIARHGIHPQPRQIGINGDIPRRYPYCYLRW